MRVLLRNLAGVVCLALLLSCSSQEPAPHGRNGGEVDGGQQDTGHSRTDVGDMRTRGDAGEEGRDSGGDLPPTPDLRRGLHAWPTGIQTGSGETSKYKMTIQVGAPAPMGRGEAADRRVTLGE